MSVRERFAFGICIALAMTPLLAASETERCSESDIAALRSEVEQTVGARRGSLFVIERNDLGSRLVDLQYLAKTAGLKRGEPSLPLPISDIRVFEFSRSGSRVDSSGSLIEVAVDLDDAPLWRVAYDSQRKGVYHLFGFEDRIPGFNALMSSLSVVVGSADVAIEIGTAFAALTERDGLESVIHSKLDLLRAALKYYPGPDDIEHFLAYWRQCPDELRKGVVPPSAVHPGNNFTVRYFNAASDGVEAVSLTLGSDGQIKARDQKVMYKWPGSTPQR